MAAAKTAGIIIIGDEILTGKVQDVNSFFLAKELWSRGVDVCRISVIPDRIDVIASEVSAFSEKYDYVFTSGGIGPTHDDITIEGVSQAFGVKIVISDILRKVLEQRHAVLTPEQLKMAEVPEGAELINDGDLKFPLIKFGNVFIFPGIPQLLRKKFYAIEKRFSGPMIFLRRIYFRESESVLACYLNEIVADKNGVKIGSYPATGEEDYSVMVTLECSDAIRLDTVARKLMAKVSKEKIIRVDGDKL
ncbi:MAG: competence/damage-inducible protein A [Dissulfurispiraceae bacterium]|jgi:molybdenum cofactor synthesis domain-containing protein